MSRVGKQPIAIPSGVTAAIEPGRVVVRGPKGEVVVPTHAHTAVVLDGGVLRVTVAHPDARADRALWGLTARLLANAVRGVTTAYERQLEVHGVGFRVEVASAMVTFHVGFSHPVRFPLPSGVTASVEKNVITLRGVDKQLVGETAARMRRIRPPDAYHGKGIRFVGEQLKLKPGKAAKAGAAAK